MEGGGEEEKRLEGKEAETLSRASLIYLPQLELSGPSEVGLHCV